MTSEEINLLQKIENFNLDDKAADFKFSERLARENGWSIAYTNRVITEYKRFLFLCCITETGVTPSDPVDQAWHLHLTFTRSYWVDLCQNTIGKQIHHNPTKGGKQEAAKFNSFYQSSNQLYQSKFGAAPPADIWHDSKTRFSDINFQRVNLGKYWLIKKPRLSLTSVALPALVLISAISIQASETTIIPILVAIVIIVTIAVYRADDDPQNPSRKKDSESSFGGGDGCNSSDNDSSHHSSHHGGDSGCSSGCSGCSGSGCSGCGGD